METKCDSGVILRAVGYIYGMSFREFFNRAVGGPAPELSGGDLWLNSEPITILNKPDHVFMVDFWTYS